MKIETRIQVDENREYKWTKIETRIQVDENRNENTSG